MGKVGCIGGGGVRTPLVIFGINECARQLGVDEVVLFDVDPERARMMAALGRAVVERDGGSLRVRESARIEDVIEGADFVLSSIRVGGTAGRTRDEQAAIQHGYPGQETTGPAGMAMALRTVPVAIEQARIVHRLAPHAWLINFTNPAGLITQAVMHHTEARVVGICDTPSEMVHRIAGVLGADSSQVRCEYLGLNHLGWVRKIELRGKDVTDSVLADDAMLAQLYPAPLFDHELIRSLRLIPTEYLYFYYSRRRALSNQRSRGSTRGSEVERMNEALYRDLHSFLSSGDGSGALGVYTDYLKARSGTYMLLESTAQQALQSQGGEDPFHAANGYHRIALEVMRALRGQHSQRVIVNVRNQGAIDGIDANDVVEVPCGIANDRIVPEPCGSLPASVRGLVLAVKEYERATIEAAALQSLPMARKAMLLNPAIGEWEPSEELLHSLRWPSA
ncbi:MAG: 6-phospho-beta-glucosidase [Acidobacteriota bacterium]